MTNYAIIEQKSARLSGEFGFSYASRLFGEDVIAQLPRYVRGPKKGQVKGYIVWEKVVRGGWVRGQGVATPGVTRAKLSLDPNGVECFRANYLGRVQDLNFHRDYLGEEGRRREVERQQEVERHNAAIKQEVIADLEDKVKQYHEVLGKLHAENDHSMDDLLAELIGKKEEELKKLQG
jgi:hypothetical protein